MKIAININYKDNIIALMIMQLVGEALFFRRACMALNHIYTLWDMIVNLHPTYINQS